MGQSRHKWQTPTHLLVRFAQKATVRSPRDGLLPPRPPIVLQYLSSNAAIVAAAVPSSAVHPLKDLMRMAFNPKTGNLTDYSLPEAEREGYAHLFAGAISSFKNPHSHRVPGTNDIRVAQDQVLLASHLLRIVDAAKDR